MSIYTDYIKEKVQVIANQLEEDLGKKYNIHISNELDFNFNPNDNDILIVVKELAGSVVDSVKVLPIQFDIFTSANEVNNTKVIFNMFVSNYSNTNFILETDFYKQDYTTPVDTQNFLQIGSSERAFILVNGTLVIATSISDVTELRINGEKINYTNIDFSYGTNQNTKKLTNENLQKSMISTANLMITITAFGNTGDLDTMLHLLRIGRKSPNDKFTLDCYYTDGKAETYTCRIQSYTGNHNRSTTPMRTITFVLC